MNVLATNKVGHWQTNSVIFKYFLLPFHYFVFYVSKKLFCTKFHWIFPLTEKILYTCYKVWHSKHHKKICITLYITNRNTCNFDRIFVCYASIRVPSFIAARCMIMKISTEMRLAIKHDKRFSLSTLDKSVSAGHMYGPKLGHINFNQSSIIA